MKVELLMPQMGESITEGTISKWRKAVGEAVEKDEVLLEISTDKVDSEVPAPAAGVVTELRHQVGDVVAVKTVLAIIDTEGKATAGTPKSNGAPAAQKETAATAAKPNKTSSPLAQVVAEKHQVSDKELSSLPGTGAGGKIVKEDVLKYVEAKAQPISASSSAPATKAAPAAAKPAIFGPESQKIVPMDSMRQAIAEHMVRSKHTSPHVYSVQECDVTKISKFRQKYKDEFKKREGFNLSFTPFFIYATVKALQKFPYVNSSVEGKSIILKKHINLGCAVALGDAEKGFGLIVPVIRQAEERNFVGLARSLNDLALRARSKKLLPEEVSGGTFTITNPGIFGTMIGTPIINQPQVGILCLGAIHKKPVVVDDMIAIRERCYITLSYDHRAIDGSLSGSFLSEIRAVIENWDEDQQL